MEKTVSDERERLVEAICRHALERDPQQVAGFIATACGGDEELQAEVKRRVALRGRGAAFMDLPATVIMAQHIAGTQARLLDELFRSQFKDFSFVGKGGMGEVYKATDEKLDREVAIKILPTAVAADAEWLRRFKQEARAASALNHPNILTVHNIGELGPIKYIVSEFIRGHTLSEHIRRRRLKIAESLEISLQIASALATAHDRGILHRDIKPLNIMLREDGIIKILDFGLAKFIRPSQGREGRSIGFITTDPEVLMGTPEYMSPEHIRKEKLDGRTDVWSLGVVLYEMIAGRSPFRGPTSGDSLSKVLNEEPPQPSTKTPKEIQRILSKALQKDRGQRYQSAREMLTELKEISASIIGEERGRKLAADALRHFRRGALREAGSMMKEAFKLWPELRGRNDYGYKAERWEQGVDEPVI
jgi:hypothetical protein